jgi:hypothetical protein
VQADRFKLCIDSAFKGISSADPFHNFIVNYNSHTVKQKTPRIGAGIGPAARPRGVKHVTYFRMNRTAKTSVEKIKQPRAKLRSVFLEMVIVYLTLFSKHLYFV